MKKESVSDWMDEEAVRALAESLLKPAPGKGDSVPEVDPGDDFVGFAEVPKKEAKSKPAVEAARKTLSEAQSKAASSGVISSASSRAETLKKIAKPPPPKAGIPKPADVVYVSKTTDKNPYPPKRRIESPFSIAPNQTLPPIPGKGVRPPSGGDSLESFGQWLKKNIPTQSFFVCNPDGRIAIDEIKSEKLIRVAQDLVSEANDGGSSHHVKIGEGKVLEVIEVKGERGTSILGITVPRPLSESAVAAVSNALNKALANS